MGLFDKFKKKDQQMPQFKKNPAEEQFQLAMDYSNKEQHSEALAAFRKVLELDPNYQPDVVHYGIALCYDAQGMTDFALEELAKVIYYNPAHVEAHFVSGTLYARKNRFSDAINEYERVLQMAPNHELAPELRKSIDQWKADASGGTIHKLVEDLDLFIKQAEQAFKVKLDYTPQSLAVMDGLIDAGWNPQSGGMGVLRLAGTYVGEVIVRNLGGEWRVAQPVEESGIEGVGRAGVRPFFMALDKFKKGKAGSLFESYKELAAEIEGVRKSMYG